MRPTAHFAALGALSLAAMALPAEAREMSTDRPDKTESAYTVPQGMWQIEMDLANWTQNEDGAVETEVLSLAAFNLKYGIGANTDLQLVVTPYTRVEASGPGFSDSVSGFDDVTVRLKHNVFGNDDGRTAFAIMPFVTLPTADDELGGSDDVTGGVILPYAVALSDTVGMGLMAQVNALKDSNGDYAPEFVLSGTIGMELTERFGAYGELFFSKFDDTGEETQATFDAGVTYSPNEDLQFDVGANFGLNDNSDDLQIFLGVSRRW